MPLHIIIVEEPGPLGPDLARLLRYKGFKAVAALDLEDALLLVRESAPTRVALLVSSTLAASQSERFDLLFQQTPKPLVRFLCTGPLSCPMHPGLRCPGLDCFQKPLDFIAPDLTDRLNKILPADSPSLPPNTSEDLATSARFCFARATGTC
jgi:hypothetical protein